MAHSTQKQNSAESAADLTIGLRAAEEAAMIGTDTLQALSLQQESLASSEDNVESQEYILQRSMRKLRGMTWSGMLYNAFTSEPPVPDVRGRSSQNDYQPNNNCNVVLPSDLSYQQSQQQLMPQAEPAVTNKSSKQQQEDAELEAVLRSVQRLHGIGSEMGKTFEAQNKSIDRLHDKIDHAQEHTLAVLLKTAQLNQRSRRSSAVYQCPLTFAEVSSGRYLQAADDMLRLSNITDATAIDRSMVFHHFTKEEHLFGLQNAKTLRFVGVTMWGTVKAASSVFGSYEEVYIDIVSGGQIQGTGILILGCNWGGGGWLKADEKGDLIAVSNSINDTQNILRFRIKELPVNRS